MNDELAGRIAYPGLRPFAREEFDLFFGRDDCVDEMVDTLAANRFLAVLGTSGSGKSSLVRTGLLNALELGFLASAGSNWQIADLRPRGHPIRSLALALLELQGVSEPDEGEVEILSAFLRRGPRSLVEWYQTGHLAEGTNLVVLVDQFEELFRYEDYSGREEAEAFVALLIEAARETSLPLYVVITMRSEYLGACTLIDALPEIINRGLYLTPRMTREECREAIDGPAGVCGFAIEDALINRLLNDLTDFAPWEAESGHDQRRRLGRRADQLPLMQHVLNLLWQRARSRSEADVVLTLDDYEAAGHLAGALDRHADEVAASVDPAHADVIDTVFRGLVTGRTVVDAVRRPTRFGELVELAGGRRESVAAVIDAFRAPGVSFLTPAPPEELADDTFIDISHESLIRQWQRLSGCLDEEAQSADAWNQLLSRAERYEAGTGGLLTDLDLDNLVAWWGRTRPTEAWANRYGNNFEEARRFLDDSQTAEAERKRREDEDQRKLIEAEQAAKSGTRFKRLSGALAAAVVLAAVGAGAALFLWREANQQATLATEQAQIAGAEREEAERQRQLADQQREEAERQEQLADQERQRAEEQAAIADRERERAQEQATLAEEARERAIVAAEEAVKSAATARAAQAAAETAREEAVAAREEAASANARLVAQQLGIRINAYHAAVGQSPDEVAKAGSLLSRAAEAAYVENPADATVSNITTVELLRPALSLQTTLATAMIPETPLPEQEDIFRLHNPPGGSGLSVVMNWSFAVENEFFRIIDPIGRVIARYPFPPTNTAFEETPVVGAALIGPDIPAGVLATADGHIWAAFGEHGAFAEYADAAEDEAERIDDIRYDSVGERLYILYVARSSRGRVSRLLVLDRESDDWSKWLTIANLEITLPVPAVIDVPTSRIAGIVDDVLYAVVDDQLLTLEINGDTGTFDGLGRVIDAVVTVDGAQILVGTAARDCAADRILADDDPSLVEPNCLVLIDRAGGDVLWKGDAQQRMRLHTAHSVGGVDPSIEIVAEKFPTDVIRAAPPVDAPWVANDMWVRTLKRVDGAWTDSLARFDPEAWGQADFGPTFAVAAATGAAYPTTLDQEYLTRLFEARILPRIAGKLEDPNPVLNWHIDGNEFRLAHVAGDSASDDVLEVRVYRPELGEFILDEAFTPEGIVCPASADRSLGVCTFVSGEFAPDGDKLLLTTNYGEHAFIAPGQPVEWRPNAPSGEGDRRLSAITGLSPLDATGRTFVVQGPAGDLWRLRDETGDRASPEGAARSGPFSAGADDVSDGAAASLKPIAISDDLRQVIAAMDDFTTDPSTGLIYIRGSSGLLILSLGGPEGLDARQQGWIASNTIADVASLGGGRFVIATSDGNLALYLVDGGTVIELDTVETGLSGFGAIKLSAANNEVVANAGDAGNYWLRSIGYAIENNRFRNRFATPWDNFAGQLENGEVASVAFGAEVFGPPHPLPAGQDLLGLTVMREQRDVNDAFNEFRHIFQLLSMRPDGSVREPEVPCGTAVAVAARVDESAAVEEAFNTVWQACRLTPEGLPFAEAVGRDGRDRVLALLRLAGSSPYAYGLLAASLRDVAPAAAEALESYEAEVAPLIAAETVADLAAGAPIPEAIASTTIDVAADFDPYRNWLLAAIAEREGADPEPLARALYHYARAEKQFRAVGHPVPPQVAARRAALARVLADDLVIDVSKRVLAEAPADGGIALPAAGGSSVASLNDIAEWLGEVQGQSSDPDSVTVLIALVEEALGDALLAEDPERAAAHYRQAMQLIASSQATLSTRGGLAGRLDEVEAIRDKMRGAGMSNAEVAAAAVILDIVDAEIDAPATRDGELRSTIREAFEQLAAADAGDVDIDRFKDLRLAFLDYDWESQFQSINQTTARAFLSELEAAEGFFIVVVERAGAAERPRWLVLRGRTRFWLATLGGEDLPSRDPADFDRWLAAAIADFEAVGDLETVPVWDAVVLGSAYSRMIDRAPAGTDIAPLVAGATAAFERAIADPEFAGLTDYRRRLAFDGYVVALERALLRLRRDPTLSGFGSQPGDAGYDRDVLAGLAFDAFSLARQREAVRSRADRLGLLRDGSGWSLDTPGDYYWGFTAAQAGAQLRIESGANGPATECDRLAVHPYDVGRSTAPVSYGNIDVDAALEACAGDAPRTAYNRARALSKRGDADAEVMASMVTAAQAGVPIAYNNLAIILGPRDPDFIASTDLLTTFSSLSLVEAYAALANLFRTRLSDDERRDTFWWLASKVADLDVPEAHRDLADLASDDFLTRGFHLAVAVELFADAGRNAEADAASAELAGLDLSSEDIQWVREAAKGRERTELVLIDDALASRILDLE